MGRGICRHCHKCKVNRPRGLCWSCYYSPGVLALYQVTSKFGRRGVGNLTGNRPMPRPTKKTLPGTPQRLKVYARRAARGQSLFHPDDATRPD